MDASPRPTIPTLVALYTTGIASGSSQKGKHLNIYKTIPGELPGIVLLSDWFWA